MIDNHRALDLIERAERAARFCACGEPTITVVRGGAVWLECSSVQTRPAGRIHRLLAVLAAPGHTRRSIGDLASVPG